MPDIIQIAEGEMASYEAMLPTLGCETQDDYEYLAHVMGRAKDIVDQLEASRKAITDPLNRSLKEVNGRYKGPREAAERVVVACKTTMAGYLARQGRERLRLQREADEKRAEEVRAAAAALQSGDEWEQVVAMDVISNVPAPVETVAPVDGLGTAKRWTWELVDLASVPDEYKVLDEVKLNKCATSLKQHARVPGIRFFETISFRRKS